jgi:hypothetical protein
MTEPYPAARAVTLVAVDIAKSCHDYLANRVIRKNRNLELPALYTLMCQFFFARHELVSEL